MRSIDLYTAMRVVDDDILERSEVPTALRRPLAYRKWPAVAACLVLIVSLTGGILVAEAKEYNAAVDFFEENGLSLSLIHI